MNASVIARATLAHRQLRSVQTFVLAACMANDLTAKAARWESASVREAKSSVLKLACSCPRASR